MMIVLVWGTISDIHVYNSLRVSTLDGVSSGESTWRMKRYTVEYKAGIRVYIAHFQFFVRVQIHWLVDYRGTLNSWYTHTHRNTYIEEYIYILHIQHA